MEADEVYVFVCYDSREDSREMQLRTSKSTGQVEVS